MKTQIRREGDTVIVSIHGKLDYETQEPLKRNLDNILNPPKPKPAAPKRGSMAPTGASAYDNEVDSSSMTPASKVIFNLENLEFVGSCGISHFIQTLKEFNSKAQVRTRYCHVRNEFKRMFKSIEEDQIFECFDNEEKAKRSFDQ